MNGSARLIRIGLYTLVLLVAGFGGWAFLTEISGAVIAPGRLVAMQDDQVAQHPEGGVVSQILVGEGDQVEAGSTLLRLDDKVVTAELEATRYRKAALAARIARLEAEQAGADAIAFPGDLTTDASQSVAALMVGQREIFAARGEAQAADLTRLEQQQAQSAARIDGLSEQRHALVEQITLVKAELEDQESLAGRGLSTETKVSALRRDLAALIGKRGEVDATVAETEAQVLQMKTELAQTRIAAREKVAAELDAARLEHAALVERLVGLEARAERLEIRAPISGRVHDLRVHALGAVIRGADPVARIVSDAAPARLIARIAPIHVADVHPGQKAKLRFPALNSRTTPELVGELSRVSADTLADQASGETYYEVEVEIAPEALAELGQSAMVPGMPVEAYIQTEARSPMSYFLKPVSDYFTKAFREG